MRASRRILPTTKNLTLYLIALILFFNLTSRSFSGNNNKSQNITTIDNYLEDLERHIKAGDNKNACIKARASAQLIKENINELKELEPYYLWNEMRQVLIARSTLYCKD